MKPKPPAGFTLLELLVALTVFGFLLVGLSQTVRFGLLAWQHDIRLSDGKSNLEAVDRSLRTIVENLSPGDDSGRPAINGTHATLTGLTRLRIPGSQLEAERVEAGIALSGQRLVLRWRQSRHVDPFGAPAPAAETELIGNVAGFGIDYWQAPGVWVQGWQAPNLPLLVRFRLKFAGDHPPRWPDIVVAPLLSRP